METATICINNSESCARLPDHAPQSLTVSVVETTARGAQGRLMGAPLLAFFHLLICLSLAPIAHANTRCHPSTDICFPVEVIAETRSLPLVGVGLFRYWGFQVYHVALYAPQGLGTPQEILNPVPKRLVIHYFREFTIKDFQKSGRTVIADNPTIRAELVESGLRQIDALYRPIKPGDRYEVTFLPGVGTQLSLNGELLGTITGSPQEIEEFQRAYFGIWLAPQHSIDDDLREEILSIS